MRWGKYELEYLQEFLRFSEVQEGWRSELRGKGGREGGWEEGRGREEIEAEHVKQLSIYDCLIKSQGRGTRHLCHYDMQWGQTQANRHGHMHALMLKICMKAQKCARFLHVFHSVPPLQHTGKGCKWHVRAVGRSQVLLIPVDS